MKTILKVALLGITIVVCSIIEVSACPVLPSHQAIQLAQKNFCKIISAMSYEISNPTVQQVVFEKHVRKFDWLPGYIVKKNVESRMSVADNILRPCIDQYGLDLLRLPGMWRLPFASKGYVA